LANPDVVVKVLDGATTIGGTKILVGWGGEGAFLDFGMNYATWGRYFEEYLKPRAAKGLYDLWQLGIVPPVQGLYRDDVTPAGLRGGEALPVRRVGGVFVSHAHLDHAGLVGVLRPELPLIASQTTAAILKATQDVGKPELWSSPCYGSQYALATVGAHGVLRADAKRPNVGRPLRTTDAPPTAAFSRFWTTFPWMDKGSRGKDLVPAETSAYAGEAGLAAKAHLVDHSVFGGSGFVLESPNGPIVYTGDLRQHGRNADHTKAFLESLQRRRPYFLLMEGTQVHPPGKKDLAERKPDSEEGVRQACLSAVDDYAGRLVLADFAPRNVERLLVFLDVARRTNRRLVVFPKDAYLLYAMHQADPSIPLPGGDIGIYDPPSATQAPWETWLLQSQFPTSLVTAAELRRAPSQFILCFSVFDLKHLLDLEPEGGAYIYSNSEAHSEEQEIDFERLDNWLRHFGLDPLGFQMVDDPLRGRRRPRVVGAYHCSGHMPGEQVLDWIVKIQPENLVPVHTTHQDGFVQAVGKLTDVKVHRDGIIR
jgi:ribonuclease J